MAKKTGAIAVEDINAVIQFWMAEGREDAGKAFRHASSRLRRACPESVGRERVGKYDDNSNAEWERAFSCVGEIDLGTFSETRP